MASNPSAQRLQHTQTGGGSVLPSPPPSNAPKSDQRVARALQPYICGGSAAITAGVSIHPIDLIKVHKQLAGQKNPKAKPSFFGIGGKVFAESGMKGLFAGVSAGIYRQMVYGTARMGMHRAVSDELLARKRARGEAGGIAAWQKAASASGTGAIAALLGCPMDVTLVRMQADTMAPAAERRNYTSVFAALKEISATEGVTALWRGAAPLVGRGAAMNLGQMATYDQVKETITVQWGSGMQTNLASAAVAGFGAAFTSLPFDLMKSRLMNMSPDPATGKLPYSGLLDCGAKIIRHEGVLGLWTGYWTYYVRCAPNSMIALLAVEQFTSMYKKVVLGETQ